MIGNGLKRSSLLYIHQRHISARRCSLLNSSRLNPIANWYSTIKIPQMDGRLSAKVKCCYVLYEHWDIRKKTYDHKENQNRFSNTYRCLLITNLLSHEDSDVTFLSWTRKRKVCLDTLSAASAVLEWQLVVINVHHTSRRVSSSRFTVTTPVCHRLTLFNSYSCGTWRRY